MRIDGLRWDEAAPAPPWRPTRVEGVWWLPLHLDEPDGGGGRTRGAATVLIRMDPGCAYAPHRHVGAEDVLVLAGGYRDELGEHRQGDHVRYPAGSAHAPRALGERGRPVGEANPACVLFTVAHGGIELLDRPA